MLAFVTTLDNPDMVGVNPEYAHETMAGLNFVHHVAQAIECGKLFHIDLNCQKMGRFDQDLRFGSEDLKRQFQSRPPAGKQRVQRPEALRRARYRTEDSEGVWDFARGCMRTYRLLAKKAHHFDALAEVQEGARGSVRRRSSSCRRSATTRRTCSRPRSTNSTRSPSAATTTAAGSTSWWSTCCSVRGESCQTVRHFDIGALAAYFVAAVNKSSFHDSTRGRDMVAPPLPARGGGAVPLRPRCSSARGLHPQLLVLDGALELLQGAA